MLTGSERSFHNPDETHPAPPSNGAISTDAARYIAEFAYELASVARHAKLDLLAQLLAMAHLEAETKSRLGQRGTKDGRFKVEG